MKTLIINASMKNDASHSYMVARKFAEGMEDAAACEIESIYLSRKEINHCRGCFGCWKVTPGKCVVHDDMEKMTEKILESDVIIFAFPLYFFGISSIAKTMLDRLLPLKMPYAGRLATEENPIIMDFRYDFSNKKIVLVSSCAHASTDIVYESVEKQFDMICGKNNYIKVFTPQGEILMLEQMKPILNSYLNKVKEAGMELAQTGTVSVETQKKVCAPLIPVRAVQKMMSGYWEDYPQ